MADFKARMPKGIDYTCVLHLDEGHVHIHILAMNTADPKLDANKLHAGKVAAAVHRDQNVSDAIESLPKNTRQRKTGQATCGRSCAAGRTTKSA